MIENVIKKFIKKSPTHVVEGMGMVITYKVNVNVKKKMNSYLSDNVEFVYKGKDVFGEVTVKLDGDFRYYPFVDTLCFLDEKKKQKELME